MSKANREKRTSVRGNTAKYTPEKPLFGKYVGSVYRPEHERGVPENSAMSKDLEIMTEQKDMKSPKIVYGAPKSTAFAQAMFWTGEWEDYTENVVCPYCGFDYVHVGEIKRIVGKDDYKASHIYDMGVRGDVIVLPFFGECGHEWVLVLGQHKGQISYRVIMTSQSE